MELPCTTTPRLVPTREETDSQPRGSQQCRHSPRCTERQRGVGPALWAFPSLNVPTFPSHVISTQGRTRDSFSLWFSISWFSALNRCYFCSRKKNPLKFILFNSRVSYERCGSPKLGDGLMMASWPRADPGAPHPAEGRSPVHWFVGLGLPVILRSIPCREANTCFRWAVWPQGLSWPLCSRSDLCPQGRHSSLCAQAGVRWKGCHHHHFVHLQWPL